MSNNPANDSKPGLDPSTSASHLPDPQKRKLPTQTLQSPMRPQMQPDRPNLLQSSDTQTPLPHQLVSLATGGQLQQQQLQQPQQQQQSFPWYNSCEFDQLSQLHGLVEFCLAESEALGTSIFPTMYNMALDDIFQEVVGVAHANYEELFTTPSDDYCDHSIRRDLSVDLQERIGTTLPVSIVPHSSGGSLGEGGFCGKKKGAQASTIAPHNASIICRHFIPIHLALVAALERHVNFWSQRQRVSPSSLQQEHEGEAQLPAVPVSFLQTLNAQQATFTPAQLACLKTIQNQCLDIYSPLPPLWPDADYRLMNLLLLSDQAGTGVSEMLKTVIISALALNKTVLILFSEPSSTTTTLLRLRPNQPRDCLRSGGYRTSAEYLKLHQRLIEQALNETPDAVVVNAAQDILVCSQLPLDPYGNTPSVLGAWSDHFESLATKYPQAIFFSAHSCPHEPYDFAPITQLYSGRTPSKYPLFTFLELNTTFTTLQAAAYQLYLKMAAGQAKDNVRDLIEKIPRYCAPTLGSMITFLDVFTMHPDKLDALKLNIGEDFLKDHGCQFRVKPLPYSNDSGVDDAKLQEFLNASATHSYAPFFRTFYCHVSKFLGETVAVTLLVAPPAYRHTQFESSFFRQATIPGSQLDGVSIGQCYDISGDKGTSQSRPEAITEGNLTRICGVKMTTSSGQDALVQHLGVSTMYGGIKRDSCWVDSQTINGLDWFAEEWFNKNYVKSMLQGQGQGQATMVQLPSGLRFFFKPPTPVGKGKKMAHLVDVSVIIMSNPSMYTEKEYQAAAALYQDIFQFAVASVRKQHSHDNHDNHDNRPNRPTTRRNSTVTPPITFQFKPTLYTPSATHDPSAAPRKEGWETIFSFINFEGLFGR